MTAATTGALPVVEGPWFEDLSVGDVFTQAPPITLTEGLAAAHQAIVGDRLRLVLDAHLGRRVTGSEAAPVHPGLVWDVAIGQSTTVSHRVKANLFYRGLVLQRAPVLGDTLHTRTEVVALRQNRDRPGRAPTGLAALRITTVDQHQRPVLDFWRCPMLPLRDPEAVTGHADDIDAVGRGSQQEDQQDVREAARAVAGGWDLRAFREALEGVRLRPVRTGDAFEVGGGDVVEDATALARLTLNTAAVHHDARAGGGSRLVYGGHTIGLALHQVNRALPQLVTVLAWESCDHTGPVREGDTLHSTVSVEGVEDADGLPGGQLAQLRVVVRARPAEAADGGGDDGGSLRDVLDWRFTALVAA
jgi:acyl dehydratase